MNRLRQFWRAVAKVFDFPRRLQAIRDGRTDPPISAPVLTTSLLLGAVLRVPSLLQLQAETHRPGFQRLVGRAAPISDDAFAYGLEHARLEDLRGLLVAINQTLKRNKAFEPAKINGLLGVALDANEQFKSRARCCPECAQRRIREKNAQGQEVEVIEYSHRFVCAQMHGPHWSTILDVEPLRPGEDEAAAALRLLDRLRRLYGPRFFDVVTVDAWYAKGPFLQAVQRLGWGVVAVLKQERYEIYQEATALIRGQKPEIFLAEHQRWCVENHAFNELTQHYHLEHCPHHEPVAIIAWLLLRVLGFVLFEWFTRLHGKLLRWGATLQEVARQLALALARWEELAPLWSG